MDNQTNKNIPKIDISTVNDINSQPPKDLISQNDNRTIRTYKNNEERIEVK